MLCNMSSLHVIRMSPVRRMYVTGTSKLRNMSTWLISRPAENRHKLKLDKTKNIYILYMGCHTVILGQFMNTIFILLILFSMYELNIFIYRFIICSMVLVACVSDGITILKNENKK